MPINQNIIKNIIRNSIIGYARNNKNAERAFQILDLIIPVERNIRSIVGGLEGSLGKTLWEPLAKTLAQNNGFAVINDDLKAPSIMPSGLNNILQNIKESRENLNAQYNAITSHDAIKHVCQQFIVNTILAFRKPPRGNGVDIWLQKDGNDYFFDTKTVQPNIGDFKKYLGQLLNWYAYYYSRRPNGNAMARIVFPYNPYPGDFWQHSKGNGRPLEAMTEGLVENQFWDLISGEQNTFDIIKVCFVELRSDQGLQEELNNLFYN